MYGVGDALPACPATDVTGATDSVTAQSCFALASRLEVVSTGQTLIFGAITASLFVAIVVVLLVRASA